MMGGHCIDLLVSGESGNYDMRCLITKTICIIRFAWVIFCFFVFCFLFFFKKWVKCTLHMRDTCGYFVIVEISFSLNERDIWTGVNAMGSCNLSVSPALSWDPIQVSNSPYRNTQANRQKTKKKLKYLHFWNFGINWGSVSVGMNGR